MSLEVHIFSKNDRPQSVLQDPSPPEVSSQHLAYCIFVIGTSNNRPLLQLLTICSRWPVGP